ncbi:MAG: hypothetical protein EOM21_19330 [Gammaproteobacteria bacterium]|nr:hypothetical protein [Gammaproteobacteria bacterium]
MSEPSQETQRTWAILKQVSATTLERKRRLGEYAVVWENDQPTFTEGDAPQPIATDRDNGDRSKVFGDT